MGDIFESDNPDDEKPLSQQDIEIYLRAAYREDPIGEGRKTGTTPHNETFFEGKEVIIPYYSGVSFPKDFEKYERDLWRFVDYVSMVIRDPGVSDPDSGLEEIGDLKREICFYVEDIDRYFESGGIHHENQLRDIQDCLEEKLEEFEAPIVRLANLIIKGKTIK